MDVLNAAQQSSLFSLLNVVANGETTAEHLRYQLCEVQEFDPYEAFWKLAGSHHKGWVTASDLHAWIAEQPHLLSSTPFEEISVMLGPYLNEYGEFRYDGFLRLTMPKERAHMWLKDVTLARGGSRGPSHGISDRHLSPAVAYRLCQLFENEVDMHRHLKFHQKNLRELGVHKEMVLRFLDNAQGICAGLGGLVSPASVRSLLVDRLQAMSPSQCEALLRRINPSGVCLAPFDALTKYLGPSLATPMSSPYAHRLDCSLDRGSPLHSPRALREPLSPRMEAPFSLSRPASFATPPHPTYAAFSPSAREVKPSYNPKYSYSSDYSAHTGYNYHKSFAWDSFDARARRSMSPALRSPALASASTQASISDPLSPRSQPMHSPPSGRARLPGTIPPMLRDPGLPHHHDHQRSSSVPRARPIEPWTSMSDYASPMSPSSFQRSSAHIPERFDRYPLLTPETTRRHTRMVLYSMLTQANADQRTEESKALLPANITLESVFDTLDSGGKGFVAYPDLWKFVESFNWPLPFGSLLEMIHELQLRSRRDMVGVPGRLSLREFGALILPIDSKDFVDIQYASSDAEARSILYLNRNSDVCPRCGIHVQRNGDCAGCPTIVCTVCGATFMCYKVVSDYACGPGKDMEMPLTATSQYLVYRLLDTVARLSVDLDNDRKQLFSHTGFDLSALSDVFNDLADRRMSIGVSDLRRAFASHSMQISEAQLSLLHQRYAGHGSAEVTFPDFARQLKPRLSSPYPHSVWHGA